jgi:hypothetical protein
MMPAPAPQRAYLLAPSMDRLSDPFDPLAQILARPFATAELIGAMLGAMAALTDNELFAKGLDRDTSNGTRGR